MLLRCFLYGRIFCSNHYFCYRSEDLRVPFERFGLVRDVYLPKDYYTGYAFSFISTVIYLKIYLNIF